MNLLSKLNQTLLRSVLVCSNSRPTGLQVKEVLRHFTSINKKLNQNSKQLRGLSSKDDGVLEVPLQSTSSSNDTLGSIVKQSGGVIVPSKVNQPDTEILTYLFKSFLTNELGIVKGS